VVRGGGRINSRLFLKAREGAPGSATSIQSSQDSVRTLRIREASRC